MKGLSTDGPKKKARKNARKKRGGSMSDVYGKGNSTTNESTQPVGKKSK